MTAADANELGSLLKTMASLAGVHEYGKEEPVYRTEPSPVYRDAGSDMKGMVKLIDDGEVEEEIIQDEYDNSPGEQYLDANWPQEGDQNNSVVANKDVLVDRNKMDIAEQLMADYRAFVAENTVDNDTPEQENLQTRINNMEKWFEVNGVSNAQFKEILTTEKPAEKIGIQPVEGLVLRDYVVKIQQTRTLQNKLKGAPITKKGVGESKISKKK